MQLSYNNVKYTKANLVHKRNPDKHLLEAAGILKEATNTEDKYLIYKINNFLLNNDPDYMLQSC